MCHKDMCHVSLRHMPCVTKTYAMCHTDRCHVSQRQMPRATQTYATCHTDMCHMSQRHMPRVTQTDTMCHKDICHVSHKHMPCATQTYATETDYYVQHKVNKIANQEEYRATITDKQQLVDYTQHSIDIDSGSAYIDIYRYIQGNNV